MSQTKAYAKIMAVMMNPREKWTDERLDDLSKKVDQGFSDLKAEMKEGFERMEARFGERFEQIDKRFDDVDKRLGRVEEGYFGLNRTMWGGTCVIVAALIGSGVFG
jgi:tetrahydromethanopterin S-methyltransferase subunit G